VYLRSMLLILSCSVLLAGCALQQLPAAPAVPPAEAAQVKVPLREERFDVWYSTFRAETPAQIRRDVDNQAVMPGEDFAFSDDFTRIAVKTGKTLERRDPNGRTRTVVSENAEKFFWRPGTNDLLYLVRDAGDPRTSRWFLHRAGQTDQLVAEAPLANLLLAQVSPDGRWLAYYYLKRLNVVSLADATAYSFPMQDGESSGRAIWAGPTHLSVSQGARVALIQVPSGERTTFATAEAPVSSPAWTRDGRKAAVRTDQATLVFQEGNLVATCPAKLAPGQWSPDGRFLAFNSLADGTFHLLDTSREPKGCETATFPGIENVEAWHPDSTHVVLTTRTDRVQAADLQVWALTGPEPVLLRTLGKGATARWKAPALPYDQLVYLSATEVKERLGEPSEATTKGKQTTWVYKDLQVRISLFEDRVHRVDVEAGLITEGLAVGDDEALVQKLTPNSKPGLPGITIYDLKRESHWYRITAQEHKVQSAVVEMPAFP
jgi:hypothetical protein